MGAPSDVARRWSDTPVAIALQWTGVLAGPVAWSLDLGFSYALVQWTCGGGPPVILRIITLFALAICGGGAYAAWHTLQVTPADTPEDGGHPEQRGRFMGLLGLLLCAFFATVVVATAVPRWILDACHS